MDFLVILPERLDSKVGIALHSGSTSIPTRRLGLNEQLGDRSIMF